MIRRVFPFERLLDLVVHIVHGLENAFAEVAGFVPVAKLHSFMFPRRRAAWNRCTTDNTVPKLDVHFDGGIPAGIQDLTR